MHTEAYDKHPYFFPIFQVIEETQKRPNTAAYAEIAYQVFSKLEACDLYRAQLVCRKWKHLIKEKQLLLPFFYRFNSQAFIHQLPHEIYFLIASTLALQDIAHLQRASKHFYCILSHPLIWQQLLKRTFPALVDSSKKMGICPRDQLIAQANLKAKRVQKITDLALLVPQELDPCDPRLAFSPNSQIIEVHCISMNRSSLWHMQTKQLLSISKINGVADFFFAPNGQSIVSVSIEWDKSCGSLWDLNPLKLIESWEVCGPTVSFSPDSQQIASIGEKFLWILNTQTRKRQTLSIGQHNPLVQFSPSSQRMLIHDGEQVSLWDTQTSHRLKVLSPAAKLVRTAFSPDSQRLVLYDQTSLQLIDVKTGEQLSLLDEGSFKDLDLFFSADSKRLVTQHSQEAIDDQEAMSHFIRLWDAQTGKCLQILEENAQKGKIFLSPNGHRLITMTPHSTRLWDAETGQHLQTLLEGESKAEVAFSPNSQRIVTVSSESIDLWDGQTGQHIQQIFENSGSDHGIFSHGDPAPSIIYFSLDSKRAIINYQCFRTYLCDMQTGHCLNTWMDKALFLPNQQWVLTLGRQAASLWDAQTGAFLDTLTTYSHLPRIAFSPHGGQLLVGTKIFDFFPAQK